MHFSSSYRTTHRSATAAVLCCSVISYAHFCKAFLIIQPHAKSFQKHHPPFRLNDRSDRSDRFRMNLSMVEKGQSESSDPNKDDTTFGLSDGDTGDWETMDIDEFLSLYGDDDFVDIDDSEELLEEFDKETLLEILGLEDDGETITLPEDDDETELEQFAEWNQLV